MDQVSSKDKDLLDTNNKLLDKLFLMTKKCREVERCAEDHKQVVQNLVSILEDPVMLKKVLSENFAIKCDPEEAAAKDEAIEALKESNQLLSDQVKGLETETQKKDDQIEVLKWTKHTLTEEIGELMKEIDKMASESLKESVKDAKKLKEEVTMLKLDLKDKCKEYDALCAKMKKLEMKAPAPTQTQTQTRTYPVTAPLPQTILVQHDPALFNNYNDYYNLNDNFQSLSQNYQAVCHERDQLKYQMNSYANYKESIIRSQNNEISRLHYALNEAESKIFNLTTQHSMEQMAFNCQKLKEDLNQIKIKMGVTEDMLETRQHHHQ